MNIQASTTLLNPQRERRKIRHETSTPNVSLHWKD